MYRHPKSIPKIRYSSIHYPINVLHGVRPSLSNIRYDTHTQIDTSIYHTYCDTQSIRCKFWCELFNKLWDQTICKTFVPIACLMRERDDLLNPAIAKLQIWFHCCDTPFQLQDLQLELWSYQFWLLLFDQQVRIDTHMHSACETIVPTAIVPIINPNNLHNFSFRFDSSFVPNSSRTPILTIRLTIQIQLSTNTYFIFSISNFISNTHN